MIFNFAIDPSRRIDFVHGDLGSDLIGPRECRERPRQRGQIAQKQFLSVYRSAVIAAMAVIQQSRKFRPWSFSCFAVDILVTVVSSSRSQFCRSPHQVGIAQQRITEPLRCFTLRRCGQVRHVGAISDFERLMRVLFHQQDRIPRSRRLRDHREDFIRQARAQPERRLIQHHDLRIREQSAADREHLLFAAR